jgi:hypothetical protein
VEEECKTGRHTKRRCPSGSTTNEWVYKKRLGATTDARGRKRCWQVWRCVREGPSAAPSPSCRPRQATTTFKGSNHKSEPESVSQVHHNYSSSVPTFAGFQKMARSVACALSWGHVGNHFQLLALATRATPSRFGCCHLFYPSLGLSPHPPSHVCVCLACACVGTYALITRRHAWDTTDPSNPANHPLSTPPALCSAKKAPIAYDGGVDAPAINPSGKASSYQVTGDPRKVKRSNNSFIWCFMCVDGHALTHS